MNAMLTMAAVAARLGVPVTTVKNWIYQPAQQRGFPKAHLVVEGRGRSKARWDAAEVYAWRARNVR